MEKEYKYIVCVNCMTYNHAPYIEDAMNGFCMQETSFPFVCTIIDDASTDGEPNVIKDYLRKYFDLDDKSVVRNEEADDYCLTFAQHKTNKNCYFAVLYLKYNHYSIRKSKMQYISEWYDNVKYHAMCEGDDYWTAPMKLQRQVDAMNNNVNVDICAHASTIVDAKSNKEIYTSQKTKLEKLFSVDDVIMKGGGFVFTNTLLVRKDAPMYDFYYNYPLDYFCQINYSIKGGLLYLPQVMSVYRDNVPGSICTIMEKDEQMKENFIKKEVSTLEAFDLEFNQKYSKPIAAYLLVRLISTYNTSKINRSIFYRYKKGFKMLSQRQKIKVLFCMVCPSFFR